MVSQQLLLCEVGTLRCVWKFVCTKKSQTYVNQSFDTGNLMLSSMYAADGMLHIRPPRGDHRHLKFCPPWHTRQNFEKYLSTKFHENPASGSRVVPCLQRDRHDAANSCFSKFCERAKKPRVPIRTHKACIPTAYISVSAGLLVLLLLVS